MQMCFGSPVSNLLLTTAYTLMFFRCSSLGSSSTSGGALISSLYIPTYLSCSLRHFFAKKFEHALRERLEREERNAEARATGRPLTAWTSRLSTAFRTPTRQVNDGTDAVELASPGAESVRKRKSRPASIMKKLRPDMIRRTDAAPRLVNPSGWVNDDTRRPGTPQPTPYSPQSAVSLAPMLDKELVGSPAPLDVPSLPAIPEAARPSGPVNPVKVDELSDRYVITHVSPIRLHKLPRL
jgi:hypothetical protein